MANRNFQQFAGTMERSVVKLFLKATFASGVATVVDGKGIKSFARTGAGAYTVTLGTTNPPQTDIYNELLALQATFVTASGTPASPLCHVAVDDVSADGTIDIVFTVPAYNAAPAVVLTPTDPANGDTLLLEITLSNTDRF